MDVVDCTARLVEFDSVSHRSNEAISNHVAERLSRLGFELEILTYVDANQQTKVNLVAKRGTGAGGIAYLCHTDVVPVDDWDRTICGPFQPTIRSGRLYGRGSSDMKGSLACALSAVSQIPAQAQRSPIYFVCTADEEIGTVGARMVDAQSRWFAEMVESKTVGIIGEPTLNRVVVAHKGSYCCTITSRGVAAHSSSSDGLNANHRLFEIFPLLNELRLRTESESRFLDASFFPPTLSWNVTIQNEPQAVNITPSMARATIFFRPMPGVDHSELLATLSQACARLELEWQCSDRTPAWNVLPDAPHIQKFLELTETRRTEKVCFATDGGVLQRLEQLVVCGPGSIDQAHRRDEFIELEQLRRGTEIYRLAFQEFACGGVDAKLPIQFSTVERNVPERSAVQESSEAEDRPLSFEFFVREASSSDVADIQKLMRPFVVQRKILRRSRSELLSLIPNGFVAISNDEIVGFASVEIYSKKLGEIQGLVVDERFQGRGVGSELVKFCVNRGAEKGIMEIMAISASESFLRKLGFDYSLPDQKRALFYQLRSREEVYDAPVSGE